MSSGHFRFPTSLGEERNGLQHCLEGLTLTIKKNRNIAIQLAAECFELRDPPAPLLAMSQAWKVNYYGLNISKTQPITRSSRPLRIKSGSHPWSNKYNLLRFWPKKLQEESHIFDYILATALWLLANTLAYGGISSCNIFHSLFLSLNYGIQGEELLIKIFPATRV